MKTGENVQEGRRPESVHMDDPRRPTPDQEQSESAVASFEGSTTRQRSVDSVEESSLLLLRAPALKHPHWHSRC